MMNGSQPRNDGRSRRADREENLPFIDHRLWQLR